MVKAADICKALHRLAPAALKMDFDNVGFLVGRAGDSVDRILVSLDITQDVIAEAVEKRAQLIVSHHPLFFSLKGVTDEDATGRKIIALISNDIGAVCMHTNLDAAVGGVNDALADAAGLTGTTILTAEVTTADGKAYSYGRVGMLLKPTALSEYLPKIKERLATNGLRYHDAGRPVHKVATVGGSGGSYLKEAILQGCDTLLTADIKYDVFLEAKEHGINIIDGDHFCTENVVIPNLASKLRELFPDVEVSVSTSHCQTAQFY